MKMRTFTNIVEHAHLIHSMKIGERKIHTVYQLICNNSNKTNSLYFKTLIVLYYDIHVQELKNIYKVAHVFIKQFSLNELPPFGLC